MTPDPGDANVDHLPTWLDSRPRYQEPTFGQRLLGRLLDVVVAGSISTVALRATRGDLRHFAAIGVVAFYEIAMVAWSGQTVGKMIVRTRVVDRRTGGGVRLALAATRWSVLVGGSAVAAALGASPFLGVVWTGIVVSPVMGRLPHRGLHELASHTVVTSILRQNGPGRPGTPGRT